MNFEPEKDPAVAVADLQLEHLVKTTVGRGLDRQRGRAAAAFLHTIRAQDVIARIDPARQVRRLKFWASAASAMAACLAVVVGLQLWPKPATPPTEIATTTPAPVVDQVEVTRNVDGGTIVWDNEPLHVVRQQTLKKTQWFDPQEKATYSVVQPVEKVGYERLLPY
jgi:hypothetical protein